MQEKRDWRADGYRWRQNGSFKDRKCGVGFRNKIYFNVFDGPNSLKSQFTRTAYTLPEKPNEVVVVYEGDESVAAQFPHGLVKKGNRIPIRIHLMFFDRSSPHQHLRRHQHFSDLQDNGYNWFK